jgi:hypothetical protein
MVRDDFRLGEASSGVYDRYDRYDRYDAYDRSEERAPVRSWDPSYLSYDALLNA